MAERLEGRGADGAGGWLDSACRLILDVRAGILLVTLISLSQEEHRALMAAAIAAAASPRWSRSCAGTGSARRSSGTRPTSPPSSCSPR